MKKPLELPDEPFTKDQKAAAKRFHPCEGGRELADSPSISGVGRIPWLTVNGGLPPGIDVSDRTTLYETHLDGRLNSKMARPGPIAADEQAEKEGQP